MNHSAAELVLKLVFSLFALKLLNFGLSEAVHCIFCTHIFVQCALIKRNKKVNEYKRFVTLDFRFFDTPCYRVNTQMLTSNLAKVCGLQML